MSGQAAVLEQAMIKQQCKLLRMPTVASQCAHLAEEAVRERRTHCSVPKSRNGKRNVIERRIRVARLPRMKFLEDLTSHPIIVPEENRLKPAARSAIRSFCRKVTDSH
jgi:hypothetical protein